MCEKTDRQLLALVRAGLWGTEPEGTDFAADTDWPALRHAARRQTVAGVAFSGVERLPAGSRPPREVILPWFADVQHIEAANRRLDAALTELAGRYAAEGLSPVLLKGQGLAQYYREPLRRQPGDIDLYFPTGYGRANALAAAWEGVVFHPDTKYHRAFDWKGVTVENHVRYVDFYHPANRRTWARLAASLPLTEGDVLPLDGGGAVAVPAAQMNVLYVFLHLMHHFLQVGVGLRQVCDWACLLQRFGGKIDAALFRRQTAALGMARAAVALGHVVTEWLGVAPENVPADVSTPRAARDGALMLREILATGNFGHDTAMMRGFRRGHHLHNLGNYAAALCRHARIFRLCPREVVAYPFCRLLAPD